MLNFQYEPAAVPALATIRVIREERALDGSLPSVNGGWKASDAW
jgi:hypothetical protein